MTVLTKVASLAPSSSGVTRITVNDVREHILERYYRLPKEAVLRLCDVIASTLLRPTKRSCALPVDVQVLVALRFYTSGSFQSVVGEALVLIAGEAICFPTTQRAASLTSIGFFGIAGFTRVLGCIDRTYVAIKVSKEDKPVYLNRKGYSRSTSRLCVMRTT
ncbi:hypothetical protein HPB47_013224 [Ixodes persulcatus]|uniref:Uncharacterized protein n=1 Tax=Ixodes persulcatus TaxID=34615 RepID=A0AC60QZ07_IXOPE|nr:hypothetical protein HPB47_013224 [Ixodes persulcatus]